jgi:isochorismate hydrolase
VFFGTDGGQQMSERVYSEDEVLAMAREAYTKGRATFDVKAERCALLVIDMQDEFVKPGWTPYWVPEATRIVSRVVALIEGCRAVRIPVIYTAFAATHRRLDRPRSAMSMPNRYSAEGDDKAWFKDGRIWHEVAPQPDDLVVLKPSYGAFYDTPSRQSSGISNVTRLSSSER